MIGRLRRAAGYLLLALSALAALAIFALPFLGVTLAEGAVIAIGLVVVAEVGYFAGLALVGRGVWQRMTALLRAQLEELKKPKPRD
jgi:hypothetical protein